MSGDRSRWDDRLDPAPRRDPAWQPDADAVGAQAERDTAMAPPAPPTTDGYPPSPYPPPGPYPPPSPYASAGPYPPSAYPPSAYPPAGPYPPPSPYPPPWYSEGADGRLAALGPDEADRSDARRGLLRPSRVLLTIAIVVSLAIVAYGLFLDRSGRTVVIGIVGLVMLGLSLIITAFTSLRGGIDASRQGAMGRSVAIASFGGLCALGAAASLASAWILFQLYLH